MSQSPRIAAGRIVEAYGRRAIVEYGGGERGACEVFGKRLAVVCGDHVRVSFTQAQDVPRIIERLPRKTLFSRTDSQGRREELAANLSLLAVLIAPEPEIDPFVADRYLAGAAYAGVGTRVVVNKCDLASAQSPSFVALVKEFESAGYTVLRASAETRQGIEQLQANLQPHTTMFVGQSGVGKSSLTNVLVPHSMRPTRTISESTREGRHTTVSAALFRLPEGGELIDTPGVRDYAPPPVSDAQIQSGWLEFVQLAPSCRFNDCLHLREPACAVLKAVEEGRIAPRRYESYKRLVHLMRSLLPSYERPR
ncbi:MAG: ribosome small subunit-dependent GTPase A [Steroidobacteraceae bacterium]